MSVHHNFYVKNNLAVDSAIQTDDIDSNTATTFAIGKATATKVEIADTGVITEIKGNLDALEGVDVTGNITVTGTVDGVDISAHDSSTTEHGATGAVVGTTNVQTLTDKTITATTNNVAAKSLHSATTIVDVSAATAPTTGQVLTATSSTIATWQTPAEGSITNVQITATSSTNTTSVATYVEIDSMTSTPAAGTYFVSFSASGMVADGSADAKYGLFKDGTIEAHTERNSGWNGGTPTNGFELALHTQGIIAVNGAEVITAEYLADAGNTFTVNERSLILIKVA